MVSSNSERWFSLEESKEAIGSNRVLSLPALGSVFAVASFGELSSLITDLHSGKSLYSSRYSRDDVLSFLESSLYDFFVKSSSDGDWSCPNGDDPKFILYTGNQRGFNTVTRLRAIDIFDMWVNDKPSLNVVFPQKEKSFFENFGQSHNANIYSAICGVCGSDIKGYLKAFEPSSSFEFSSPKKISPIVLGYFINAGFNFDFGETIRAASNFGIDIVALSFYFSSNRINKKSCEIFNEKLFDQYSAFVELGWDSTASLLCAEAINYFEDIGYEDILNSIMNYMDSGIYDQLYISAILKYFKNYESKDHYVFCNIIDARIDSNIAREMIRIS